MIWLSGWQADCGGAMTALCTGPVAAWDENAYCYRRSSAGLGAELSLSHAVLWHPSCLNSDNEVGNRLPEGLFTVLASRRKAGRCGLA